MTKKLIAIFSSVMLLAGSTLPAFAASTIEITGNGVGSDNNANVTVAQTTQVTQTNSSNITNNVSSSSNSGGNTSSYNTGGNVTVDTGNAKTQTTVTNTANSNVANVNNCNCGVGDLDVKISGNGANTNNTANPTLQNRLDLTQVNTANIDNNVRSATSNSGENNANSNTGGGVSVMTGSATTKVNLTTDANQNLAEVGGGQGGGSTASVVIAGNGVGSDNTVNLGLTDWVSLNQINDAKVDNSVSARSNTGRNNADYNTGGSVLGDVSISTGNATTEVSADTAVNFNQAAVGCDCLLGVTAKIKGNGAGNGELDTDNTISALLQNTQLIGQVNSGRGILNGLNGDSKSGDNRTNQNTGDPRVDPSIMTGSSTSTTAVTNHSGANVFGSDSVSPFPWNWSNSNISLTFSLQELLLALGLH